MALTVANVGRGNYVLGGLGRVEGPSAAEAMDLAQREEQRFRNAQRAARETELGMQETRQRMALAQSREQRAQQTFEAQQAARAQAAANAAAQRRATAQLMEGLSGLAAPTGGAPGVAPIAPVAPPRAGLALPTGPSVPLSFGTAVPDAAPAAPAPAAPAAGTPLSMGPVTPAGGVQVASLDPMESYRLAFESRPDLFGGGVQVADASGAIPAGGPGTFPPGVLPAAEQPLFPQAPDQFVLTQIDIPNFVPGVGMINYVQYNPATGEIRGPNGQPIDPIIQEQMRESASFNYADSIENTAAVTQSRLERARAAIDQAAASGDQAAYTRALDEFRAAQVAAEAAQAAIPNAEAALRTTQPITSRGVFSEEGPGAAGLPAPVNEQVTAASGAEPASPEAAAAEAPTTAEEAAPVVETPYGGLQLNFGTPVQLSFGEFDGRGSEAYVAAPERIFQDAELANRQRQRLQLLATYYQQTNNLQGLVGVMNQLDELSVEQRYLDGMTAIVGIQQENFGPVQALLQQRYPGRQVEVRPYTDGTVEIFLDGQAEARLTWDDLATNLRGVYDRGFIAEQQTLAEQARERSNELWTLQTTELLRTQREIAVARNQAEIDRLEGSGSIERIGETANGEVIFERVVNGVPIQFVYREVMTRDPVTGDEIPALVATPIDQTLVQ